MSTPTVLLPDALTAAMRAAYWSAEAHRGDGWGRRLQRQIRAAAAAAFRPSCSRRWFSFIEDPVLRPFAQANPLLPLKPFRVYLSIAWSRERRRKVILDTYAEAIRRGGAFRRALMEREGVRFPITTSPETGEVCLRLHRDARFRKEGELTLSLDCAGLGGRAMSVAFSVERLGGGLAIYIGCLQGKEEGADALRVLTKALHGLRPKAFMMLAMQEVASAMGADELYGAGSGIQVHRGKHAIHLPRLHALGFDYDGYWVESGGRPDAGGWFRLPRETPRRSRDGMKPNKRSMYTKRYAMLDQLGETLRAKL